MKIISGISRGCKLKAPKNNRVNKIKIRPTVGRVREAIFNTIQDKLSKSLFLDLYSGTGAMGIEALSRGAREAFFIEKEKKYIDLIKTNLIKTKLINKAKIICCDACKFIKKSFAREINFDIIFLDPPYEKNFISLSLDYLEKFDLLDQNGILILQMSIREKIPESNKFDFYKQKIYGKSLVLYAKKKS